MRTLVIGLGNDDRGDDAVGLQAARRLAPVLADEAEVLAHPGEPLDMLHAMAEADLVVLIDAARSGRPAGTVVRYLPMRDALPSRGVGSSSHAVDLLVALDLARALDMLPAELVLYAVEGERFSLGEPCSPVVIGALDEVTERVTREIRKPRS